MSNPQIFIASDHAGFELKKIISQFLLEENYVLTDLGPEIYDPTDDYPDFSTKLAKKIAENPQERKGIIIGGSGQGEAMAANRTLGVRAAVFYGYPQNLHSELDVIALSREHNDANILAIGSRFVSPPIAKEAVLKWLRTSFPPEERHIRRISELDKQ